MAYINAEEVKSIREALKAKYPNFKFSVRKGAGGSSVDVTIQEGPTSFNDLFTDAYSQAKKYVQINPYWTSNYGEHAGFFDELVKIIKTAPAQAGGKAWYNNSDAMTDYFDTAFYTHLNIGAWNKNYAQVK